LHNNIKDKNKSSDMTESLGKLGPHEGQELELLLSGKKPIAYFYELLPIEFIKHLEQGSLSMISKDIETSLPFPLNELMLCIENSLKATQLEERLELDRRIGQLLGYSVQDIEFYVQHISNRHLRTKI